MNRFYYLFIANNYKKISLGLALPFFCFFLLLLLLLFLALPFPATPFYFSKVSQGLSQVDGSEASHPHSRVSVLPATSCHR